MTATITCLVLGDDRHRHTHVKLQLFKTVVDLKDAIKEKKRPVLDHLPASALALWKVSIPFDDRFEERVNALDLRPEGRLLPQMKLSSLFSKESTSELLDIVIKVPDGKLESLSTFQVLSNFSSLRAFKAGSTPRAQLHDAQRSP
jgi:hypothetical protein